MSRLNTVCALDLGTTKVCCAVAEYDGEDLHILGLGEVPTRGIRKGAVVDIDLAAEAVAEAVDAAEQVAGVPIDAVVAGFSGGRITSANSRGVVAVAGARREVRASDIERVLEAARAISVPSDQRIVHVLPQQFTVDGQEGVKDAIGMSGSRLEVDAHIIMGSNTALNNVIKVAHAAGLEVEDVALQGIASAEAVIQEEEMERGVVVADIGGGTTDIAIYRKGSLISTSVIPVGGNHVTGDLAVGLRCDLDAAEEVKRRAGHCLQLTVPADVMITMTPMGYDDTVQVPARYLAEIIGPRAREMAMLIQQAITKTGPASLYAGGVVLTGGGSLLRGFPEVVQQETDLPCRVAAPFDVDGIGHEMRDPQYATLVGLLRWGTRSIRVAHVKGRKQQRSLNITGTNRHNQTQVSERLSRWFRDLFTPSTKGD
ncbi:MAG: cell division protein FtsA [Candidatus Dormibacteria bacterium]